MFLDLCYSRAYCTYTVVEIIFCSFPLREHSALTLCPPPIFQIMYDLSRLTVIIQHPTQLTHAVRYAVVNDGVVMFLPPKVRHVGGVVLVQIVQIVC